MSMASATFSMIVRLVRLLMISSNPQGLNKLAAFVVLVVHHPRHISFGHSHSSEFDGACNRHDRKHMDVRCARMRFSNVHDHFSYDCTKLGELRLGTQEIILAVVVRHFPDGKVTVHN